MTKQRNVSTCSAYNSSPTQGKYTVQLELRNTLTSTRIPGLSFVSVPQESSEWAVLKKNNIEMCF